MTATPEQWATVEEWANKMGSTRDACVLELRDRVALLELGAGIYKAVAKEVQDHFGDANKMVNSSAGLTSSNYPEKPDSSLDDDDPSLTAQERNPNLR